MNSSIIVATYNKKDLLKKTLASVKDRMEDGDEVIVVDDGSSDGTRELFEGKYTPPKFRYIWQPDFGYRLSTVRNIGIKLANNDCIIQIDDDYLLEGSVLEKSKELYNSNRLLVIRRDESIGLKDKRLTNDYGLFKIRKQLYKLTKEREIPKMVWGMLVYSREVALELGGYSEAYNGRWGAEDTDFGGKFHHSGREICFFTGEKCLHLDHEKREDRFQESEKNREILKERIEQYRRGEYAN